MRPLTVIECLTGLFVALEDDLPAPLMREEVEGDVGVIYYGSMESTIQEIDDILEASGLKVS